jgi:hypothetical protein
LPWIFWFTFLYTLSCNIWVLFICFVVVRILHVSLNVKIRWNNNAQLIQRLAQHFCTKGRAYWRFILGTHKDIQDGMIHIE